MPSVFATESGLLYTVYDVELTFLGLVMAGVPSNPKMMEGWIRAKAGIEDDYEAKMLLLRSLEEIGVELPENATYEELIAAADAVAAETQTCVFKRNGQGIYLESRQLKAMLKESTNVLYAGEKWGAKGDNYKGKAPKSLVAERVFVSPGEILLGRQVADGKELIVGHIRDQRTNEARSTLGYHEYVRQAVISFQVSVAGDIVPAEAWPRLWLHAEKNGLGAVRSQGFGQFEVTRWEKSS